MKLPFLGSLRGKSKAEEPKGRGYVPADRVRELMGRGFSELDTIDVLRREGFSPDEIDSGLTQAIKEGVSGSGYPEQGYTAYEPNVGAGQAAPSNVGDVFQKFREGAGATMQAAATVQQQNTPSFPPRKEQKEPEKEGGLKLPTLEELQPSKVELPAMPESSLPEEYYQGYPTEEYIDYVVQERTQDVVERMNEFAIHSRELENRVKEMNERVAELSRVRFEEQKQISNSIDALAETVKEVNMRMAGLEKAFRETLPALIESVRALSDIVQRMKRES